MHLGIPCCISGTVQGCTSILSHHHSRVAGTGIHCSTAHISMMVHLQPQCLDMKEQGCHLACRQLWCQQMVE